MPFPPFRTLLCVLAVLALCVPIAACGGDDDEGSGGSGSTEQAAAEPKPLEFEVTGDAKKAKLNVPKTAEAGLLEVTLKNSVDKGAHSAQLVKIEGDESTEEVLKAGDAWGDKGKPLPDYITFAGGVGNVEPGETGTIVDVFRPGRYVVIDFGDEGSQEVTAELELTGDGGGELPAEDAKVSAREYAFQASGLKTGKTRVTFENAGKEPHHLVAAPLAAGKTREDVVKALSDESGGDEAGPPPFDEKEAVEAPIISGGDEQVVELDLSKSGDWALMCFIPDRAGGPPHAVKGMISVAKVE